MTGRQDREGSRAYRMTRRAEQVQDTRQRIVEAAVELHGSLGPAYTSVAAIADLAGVTRATLYRHFPDDDALQSACSSHWLSQQRLPDPDAWREAPDPRERLRVGLADVYRYFRDGEAMLTLVDRDREAVAPHVREAMADDDRRRRDALLEGLPGRDDPAVRALVGHAVTFSTWRSLCVEQGLAEERAVELVASLVACATVQEHAPAQI